ncbi:PilZ domain-containing protein [Myxococcaceae bacterium GXIMD 01537]
MTSPPSPSRPARAPESVRLKVAYKTPEALLGEYTRSVGQGGVTLEVRRSVPPGTRFVFEMRAKGVGTPLEVVGEVVQVQARPGERYLLTVRYAGGDRGGVDAVLQHIFAAHEHEKLRRYPRIPLNVRAVEGSPFSPSYYVRDISRGGVGLEVDAPALPRGVQVGAPFLLELELPGGTLLLHGEVAWTSSHYRSRASMVTPGFGATFGKLRPDTVARLESLLALATLPPAPWRARVSFGRDAVSRMP